MSETITLDGTEFVYRKGKWYEQSAEEDTPAGGWMIVPDSLFFRALDALATETARREQAEADAAYVALRLGELDDSYVGRYSVTGPLHFNIADGRDGTIDTTIAEAESFAELGARLRAVV